MNIGTIIFTYNRSHHTRQVLDALRANTILPEKLFLFQDGPGEGCSLDEWQAVNDLISSLDWCEKELVISDTNKGLAKSIVDGLNYVFQTCDAVIVLEDDCVTAPSFMMFMNQCLEEYANLKSVFNVSGYDYFHGELAGSEVKEDAYFCGRSCSWGWGTWKDRWQYYEQDYTLIRQLKNDAGLSKELYNWGADLEEMVVGNVRGTTDSWAVFWSLVILREQGRCVNPYKSLVRNVGFDGSGVHCGTSNSYDIDIDEEKILRFRLPKSLQYNSLVRVGFARRMGNITAVTEYDKKKEDVFVFGLGQYFFEYEDELNDAYNIKGFLDNYKKGFFAGRRIKGVKELVREDHSEKIVIMLRSRELSESIKKQLIENGISGNQIQIGIAGCDGG